MFMFDKYAYINGMNNQHPVEKLFFSIGSLLFIISSKSVIVSVTVFFCMTVMLLVRAKIPVRFYLKILCLPLIFLTMSVVAILIEFSRTVPETALWFSEWPFGYIFITTFGLHRAVTLAIVSFSATSCLYFLILTTSLEELFLIAKKAKVPVILIELFAYIYRFIFLVLETAQNIHTAQQSRLGYQTWRLNIKSFSLLISSLLTQVLQQSRHFYYASLLKIDDGTFRTWPKPHKFSAIFMIGCICYFASLTGLIILERL